MSFLSRTQTTEISALQWKVLLAGFLGWMLDATDAMLFAFALVSIRTEFGLSNTQMGALASITLFTSVGGVGFGLLADRIGRVRALTLSILTYSVFTALLATSQNIYQLVLWRALVGFGLGGEWAAGAALVAETWPASHRGRAIGLMQSGWALGYMVAAGLSALVLPLWGWRALFLIGILPAFFTIWVRSHLASLDELTSVHRREESPLSILRKLFSSEWIRFTLLATALASTVLFAYWGLFTWIPTFLATPVEKGGAGLSLFKSSAWIVPMQIGSFFGYTSFGYFSDRFGRRPSFLVFVLGAAIMVLIYGRLGSSPIGLMLMGPFVGFFGHGYFSVFGSLLAELFPGSIRATAQALCYTAGRAVSALAPMTIGYFADRNGMGAALGITAAFFLASAFLIYLLPETRGKELELE